MKNAIRKSILALGLAAGMTSAAMAQQGVTDTEVLIGSNGDQSGIFAPFNVQAVKAAQMKFDQVNADGGIHGRKIRMIVEDHQYQVPKAVANFNKLINSDGVFAMILNLGTPHNIAGFPLMQAKKVANIAPLTSARQLLEGDTTYRYAGFSSYYGQIKAGVDYLVKEKNANKICAMYIPSDFGKEIQEGAMDEAKALGKEWAAETTHKPDETDFVGALTKLKDAGCDIIATALGVRQTIIAVATAKKLNWTSVTFLGSSAAYHEAIASQPGGITDGYYAAGGWADYKPRMDDPEVKKWHDDYVAKYNEEPGMAAILGYGAAETLVRALEAAGKDLTPESFQKGMESLEFHDVIADADIKYGPGDHQGGDIIVISKVEDGVFKEQARK
ncbi:branched-chain amino acid ABC transporter substrate-binding protein [Zhengella mangrovi]|uniref:Branched-chain amino acid ABC transporter substrate-binding protein n=1 Tax=Zhengella mangrovi TaxID=1982044 RepID=A0A2G1QLW1_9HYPH|nr:ABC transporter substrate-binding protein [Zhengella mangrovi]PHP66459.1 branched-chain amino acid ABC transporter substrate-binding protein [Zhengella mangrovi]